jgi:8-oxo-dGTP pyrophosphatase MutT (NUDIX family)
MSENASDDGSDEAWKVLDTSYAFRDEWLVVRSDRILLPDGAVLPAYHTIECSDWVSCIAITMKSEVVLVEQYRHSIGRVIAEFPAGSLDDRDVSPLAAVKRELLEETGYASDDWHLIGSSPANPARQTNTSYAFLALGAEQVSQPNLDEGELIRTQLMPWALFREQVASGSLEFPAQHVACMFWLHSYVAQSRNPQIAKLWI